MAKQAFLIGIGGTGGLVLKDFRKRIYGAHHNFETEDVRISYLYIDSNENELNDRAGWNQLGEPVALQEAEKLLIGGADLERTLDDLHRQHGIRPWLGDEGRIRTITANTTGAKGANQIRRFGRFLLAIHADKVREAVRRGVQRLTEGREDAVDFHLFCTFACGTGSGSVIDIISLIRSYYGNHSSYRIFLYGFVTNNEHPKIDVGNFHANQYALLTELNALRLGKWSPHNLFATSVDTDRHSLKDNFTVAYLISDVNEKRRTCSLPSQIKLTADYLFQRIVVLHGGAPRALAQADSFEDCAPYHEENERSYFFGSFGINRLIFPEQEIREKLVYMFAKQAVLQMGYNSFSPGGFLRVERDDKLRAKVKESSTQAQWCLTDEHLQLSIDFHPLTSNAWETIGDDWRNFVEAERQIIEEERPDDREVWLNALERTTSEYFDEQFRNEGVVNYYAAMRDRHLAGFASHIMKQIEEPLFKSWVAAGEGGGIRSISKLLKELTDELNDRAQHLADLIEKARRAMADAEIARDQTRTAFRSTGFLGRVFKDHREKFLLFAEAILKYNEARTRAEGSLPFAQELLAAVSVRVAGLKSHVDHLLARIERLERAFDQEIKNRLASGDQKANDSDQLLIEVDRVHATLDLITNVGAVQKSNADTIRQSMFAQLGAGDERSYSFHRLSEIWTENDLRDLILRNSKSASEVRHEAATGAHAGLPPIIGVNVLEQMYKENGGGNELSQTMKDRLTSWLKSAATQVQFDPQATQPKELLGKPQLSVMPRRSTTIFLPRCRAELVQFRSNLVSYLKHGAATDELDVETTDYGANEIIAVSVSYWFALRFVETVQGLEKRSREALRTAHDDTVQKSYLEDGNDRLPPLILASTGDLRQQMVPSVMLCWAGGYLEKTKAANGLEQFEVIKRRPNSPRPEEQYALKCVSWTEIATKLDLQFAREIQSFCQRNVITPSLADETTRMLYLEKLENLLDAIYEERPNADTDAIYQTFVKHKQLAAALLQS